MKTTYELPKLAYGFGDLVPVLSEEQLRVHYEKHHAGYIKGAIAAFEKLSQARVAGIEADVRAIARDLSWHVSGHVLHSLFWANMAPVEKGGEPSEKLATWLAEEFGSLERFKKEFSDVAKSVEGSGWAVLVAAPETGRPIILEIEKHNMNAIVGATPLLVLDVFEHAYYVDYKNDRAKFVEEWWKVVNWEEVDKRLG